MTNTFRTACLLALVALCHGAQAQTAAAISQATLTTAPPAYGLPVTSEVAIKVARAAVADARKTGAAVSIAVTDPAGLLVYFERMDDSFTGSIDSAIDKARSASMFKRTTEAFNEAMTSGRTYLLGLPHMNPIPGGIPLLADGKVIGAVGVSGGTRAQDMSSAKAGSEQVR